MPGRRVGATQDSLLVLGVETPTAAAIATAPASVVRARPRGAPRTVRPPLLPPPAGPSRSRRSPPSGACVLSSRCRRPPAAGAVEGRSVVGAGLGRALWHLSWGDARPRGAVTVS